MTVKELIEELEQYDGKLDVILTHGDIEFETISTKENLYGELIIKLEY